MIPGLPAWALPDSYPPPPAATPALAQERVRQLAAVPAAPPLGSDWDWERFMGTALMPGVPVTLPSGQVVMPAAGGKVIMLSPPAPAPSFDPPPGTPVIQGLPDGSIAVLPLPPGAASGDDAPSINAAALQAAALGDTQGGKVRLGPYTYSLASPVVLPHMITLEGTGPATRLNCTGTNGVTIADTTSTDAGNNLLNRSGTIRDLVIDGTNAGAGAIGLDVGGGWGYRLDKLYIDNFSGAGSVGLRIRNATPGFYTEKLRASAIHLRNNTTGCLFTSDTTHFSAEYNDLDLYISMSAAGQSGVVVNGMNFTGGSLRVRGNIAGSWTSPQPATQGVLVLNTAMGNAATISAQLDVRVEDNSGASSANASNKIAMSDANQLITGYGKIDITGLGTVVIGGVAQTAMPAGTFQFRGPVFGNTLFPLRTIPTPAVPASTGSVTNSFGDAYVALLTGAVTAVTITPGAGAGPSPVTVPNAGPWFLPMNAIITITYSAAPTWVWTACT